MLPYLKLPDDKLILGYGKFPYIIEREFPAMYVQLPILISEIEAAENNEGGAHVIINSHGVFQANIPSAHFRDSNKHLGLFLELLKKYALYKNNRCCLVISENQCFFFESLKLPSEIIESNEIPEGGLLKDAQGNILSFNRKHFVCRS
jgi:hypothetical protein